MEAPANAHGEPDREHTKAAARHHPQPPDHADTKAPGWANKGTAVVPTPADCMKPAPLLALRTHRRNREHRKICVFAWKAVFSPLASGMPARTQCLAG